MRAWIAYGLGSSAAGQLAEVSRDGGVGWCAASWRILRQPRVWMRWSVGDTGSWRWWEGAHNGRASGESSGITYSWRLSVFSLRGLDFGHPNVPPRAPVTPCATTHTRGRDPVCVCHAPAHSLRKRSRLKSVIYRVLCHAPFVCVDAYSMPLPIIPEGPLASLSTSPRVAATARAASARTVWCFVRRFVRLPRRARLHLQAQ
jgi:hypothetical protein